MKTITDNAKDFQTQFSIAKIIMFEYLETWYKQVFQLADWKEIFANKPEIHTTLAAEVLRYLFGDSDNRNLDNKKNKDQEEILLAKKHAIKWADDAMEKDAYFCEFVIQTLRMEMVFQQYFSKGTWLFEDERGKRVNQIVMKYGNKVINAPDPNKYTELLALWMSWDKKRKK